jgi:hypothetical protein
MSKSGTLQADIPGVRLKKELTGTRASRIQSFRTREALQQNFLTVPRAIVALIDKGLDADEKDHGITNYNAK